MKIIEKIIAKSMDGLNTPTPTIVFLGDSVTEGCMRGWIDSDAVYHNQLKKILDVFFPDTVVDIINAGIGGTSAAFAVDRLERDVIACRPDLCVVAFGLNDLGEDEEALPRFTGSLRTIFQTLQQHNIEVIFMTENMMNDEIMESAIEPQWRDYADVACERQNNGLMDCFVDEAKKVAEQCCVPVCDCYGKWKKLRANGIRTTKLLVNGINHPIPEMHKLFAYSLIETMMEN